MHAAARLGPANPVGGRGAWICREARPAWYLILLLLAVPVAALATGRFTLDAGELAPVYATFAIFLGCGFRLRQLGRFRLANILEITGLFYFAAATTALACAVLTATALPYVDAQLAAADRALGFDWLTMIALFRSHAFVAHLLIGAYEALNWAPQMLIILLGLFRPPAAGYRFLTAWLLGLFLTALLYPLFPAIAAFQYYDLRPEMMPGSTALASWHLPQLMDALRSGANRSLGFEELTGLVTMPSFHAAGAVLLFWGFASFRRLRVPAAMLCGAMFVSAVPVGGHYLVDIIAGLGIALISILLADMIHRPASAPAAAFPETAPASA